MIDISESEWEVMRVVWTTNGCTSSEIVKVLERKKGWSSSTIKTMVGRLVKKEMLKINPESKPYIYKALVQEGEAMNGEIISKMNQLCAKKKGKQLADLIQQTTLSQHDIDRLTSLLLKKRDGAPLEIDCDCVPGQCTCHPIN